MSTPDLSREEAEKAFEKFEPGFYGSGNTYTDRRTVWLAAWSACAEKAAGVADEHFKDEEERSKGLRGHLQSISKGYRDASADIAAEIRRRLGGKG